MIAYYAMLAGVIACVFVAYYVGKSQGRDDERKRHARMIRMSMGRRIEGDQ